MRKLLVIVAIFLVPFMVAAASYADNQYQKLAEAYAVRAQDAFDSGEYDLAVEYTAKAREYFYFNHPGIHQFEIKNATQYYELKGIASFGLKIEKSNMDINIE